MLRLAACDKSLYIPMYALPREPGICVQGAAEDRMDGSGFPSLPASDRSNMDHSACCPIAFSSLSLVLVWLLGSYCLVLLMFSVSEK